MARFLRRNAATVAVAALLLALAGGGIAAAQPSTRAPAERPADRWARPAGQPPITAADARAAQAALSGVSTMATSPGTVAWAVVSASGTLLRGSPEVFSAKRYTTGEYQIIFRYTVYTKSFGATVGTLDPDNVPPPGQASVAPRRGLSPGHPTQNAVYVQTYNSAGAPANLGFHLVVHN
ncbi:hypothetical protein K7640_03245 [Micromonospora sp. PLK6-60]|uniref:hypothetical protein n=1 Tax=Micromonospora sp. PLK6-60 TaxID=2873383 RepID=UPI001CA6D89A|nr:hypothetical protein [Micromonospora sp. PLK6-60]MBY8870859.1 hypothetical protein [Micromonospora sp. PLK6-60]